MESTDKIRKFCSQEGIYTYSDLRKALWSYEFTHEYEVFKKAANHFSTVVQEKVASILDVEGGSDLDIEGLLAILSPEEIRVLLEVRGELQGIEMFIEDVNLFAHQVMFKQYLKDNPELRGTIAHYKSMSWADFLYYLQDRVFLLSGLEERVLSQLITGSDFDDLTPVKEETFVKMVCEGTFDADDMMHFLEGVLRIADFEYFLEELQSEDSPLISQLFQGLERKYSLSRDNFFQFYFPGMDQFLFRTSEGPWLWTSDFHDDHHRYAFLYYQLQRLEAMSDEELEAWCCQAFGKYFSGDVATRRGVMMEFLATFVAKYQLSSSEEEGDRDEIPFGDPDSWNPDTSAAGGEDEEENGFESWKN